MFLPRFEITINDYKWKWTDASSSSSGWYPVLGALHIKTRPIAEKVSILNCSQTFLGRYHNITSNYGKPWGKKYGQIYLKYRNLHCGPDYPQWQWAMGKEMNFLCDAVVLVPICFISLIMAPVLAVTRAWTFLPHRTPTSLFLGHRQTWDQTCEWCLTMFYNIHTLKTIINSFVNKWNWNWNP